MASPAKSATSAADMAKEGADAVRATVSLAEGESTFQSLDPLDPRKVALDIFEVYCQEMLTTTFVGRRVFLVTKLRYLVARLIGHQYDYGRLYNRTCTANIVSRVCGRHPYVIPDEVEEGDQSHQLTDCLVDFTPDKWNRVIVQFERLRESMIRNDAPLIVLPSQLDDDDELVSFPVTRDDEVNEALESHSDFSHGYTKMLDMMKFHMCLSHLQPHLETAIQGMESALIPHENIIAFDLAIQEQFSDGEDSKHACILNDLLKVDEKEDLHLKSFSEIKQLCEEHARKFDLQYFQHRFLRLIQRWTELVLPVPELSKLGYGSANARDDVAQNPMATSVCEKEDMHARGADIGKTPYPFEVTSGTQQQRKGHKRRDDRKHPRAAIANSSENEVGDDVESSSEDETEEKANAMEVLKSKREALMKNVKDPLDNCVAIAQSARRRQNVNESESQDDASNDDDKAVKTPSFRKQKKSAQQLQFDSSNSDNSEGEGAVLGEVPDRYKQAKRVQATREIKVSLKNRSGKRRFPFTEIEDGAIEKGMEKYGHGKWAHIKAHYPTELRHRTPVQIKDRWRTITKKRATSDE